ncbi:GntR family transcriptional regulator [Dongshaea marina]|uniref:GntR family transcriptional regulator n=1 Tax=Dongshaea marina TaxID=2047966 RepID=UPI000D3E61A1|nr:GntR family transcriptional regulator [Dongshaea marina]
MSQLTQKQSKRSDAIAAELEKMILEGSLVQGQRLPAERELAVRFGVSRPSVREAIQLLEAKGLVSRRHGGGTYVEGSLTKGFADPLFELLATHPDSQTDLLEFRHALEGIAAFYAASRATNTDVERIRRIQKRITQALDEKDVEAEAHGATELYVAIAEASHNLVLLHLISAIRPLLHSNILSNIEILNRRAGIIAEVRIQRAKLIEAILSGTPQQARQICDDYLAFIKESLRELQFEEQRAQRSQRRTELRGGSDADNA